MADADAIVIGSGHNGLVAAFRLARAGWRVAVLERASVIGGAIRTENVTLPGFRHDLYATNLSLFRSSLVYREHQADFDRAGLRFVTCHEAFASAYPDGRSVRIYTDADLTASEFSKCSAADLEGWRQVVSAYRRVAPRILPFANMALPSWEAAGQALATLAGLRTGVFELRNLVFGSARQFVDRFFRTEEAKGAFLPWAFHLDFAPDVPGGAAFAFVTSASAHLNGLVLAEGGADAIVSALRALIEAHGGTIHTSTEVAKVLVEDGRAIGVKTSSGNVLMASRAVIANVTPRLLFGRLVPAAAVPSQVRERALRFRYGPGVFMVHLAVARHLDWKGAEDLWRFNYVHLNGKADDITRTYAQCMEGLIPSRPMMVVSQPTRSDPSRAPEGSAVLRLQVRAVPATIAGDAAGSISPTRLDERQGRVCRPGCRAVVGARTRRRADNPRAPRDVTRGLRARKSQSDRRRLCVREPPSRPELLRAAISRVDTLPHADRAPVHGRRLDLAWRWRQRCIGIPGRRRPYVKVLRKPVRAELKAGGDSSIENLLAPGIQTSWKFFAPSNSAGSSGHGSSSPQTPSIGHAISFRRGTRFGIDV